MGSTDHALVSPTTPPVGFGESPMIPAYFAILSTTNYPTGKRHLPSQQLKPKRLRNVASLSWHSVLAVLALVHTMAASGLSMAGEADVIDASVVLLSNGQYRIDATVRHADTGWEHYANRWDVLAEDGTVLGTRELAHPHVDEQPFTRSLTLSLPAGTQSVTLRASDSVHGLGGQSFKLTIPLP